MTFIAFHRGVPAWAALAVSATSCLTAVPAIAQSTDNSLPPIIVTGSRFASDPAFAPIGATVITADQIREAGVGNVNEAIRKIGGVYGRANTTGTQDYDLDLRGFGATSSQNMVILVDGIRLSENEQTIPLLSSVPIESVERIEIIRGGGSVLYGAGATGGTIQIITKRSNAGKLRGTIFTEIGSFDQKELRASASQGWGGFSIDANVGILRTDSYRENNEVDQHNFSGGMQWAAGENRIGMRIDVLRQDSRLAGPLTLAQFKANPRQTITPNDFGSYDTDRLTLFAERRFGSIDVAAELSHQEKKANGHFDFGSGAISDSDADSRTTQFSPRIRHLYKSGKWANELVLGLDFTDWERSTKRLSTVFPLYTADVSQKSQAFYVKDEISVDKVRIAVGARSEKFDQDATGANFYSKIKTLNAWDVQGAYEIAKAINVYAKTGRSYRVANADENAFTPVLNQPLKPQTSRDWELGGSIGSEQNKFTARLFRHDLKNEIIFDPTFPPCFGEFCTGANLNLDETERKGIELEANLQIFPELNLSALVQHVSARFSNGPNDGNEIVLAPKNTATVRLNWVPLYGHTADMGVQWVDSQRYGGDFSNSCNARIPSFTTLDGRYAVRTGAWEFAVTGTNLTDRDYFTNAYGACQSGIYPDPGRQIKISARLDF